MVETLTGPLFFRAIVVWLLLITGETANGVVSDFQSLRRLLGV
jgi:hypothetical protein